MPVRQRPRRKAHPRGQTGIRQWKPLKINTPRRKGRLPPRRGARRWQRRSSRSKGKGGSERVRFFYSFPVGRFFGQRCYLSTFICSSLLNISITLPLTSAGISIRPTAAIARSRKSSMSSNFASWERSSFPIS